MRIFQRDDPRVLPVLNNLASLYLENGLYSKVEGLHLDAWLGRTGSATGEKRIRFNLASLAMGTGSLEEAERLFVDLIPVFEADGDHESVASTWNNLGLLSLKAGLTTKAVERLERASATIDEYRLSRGPLRSRILANLSVTYALAKRSEDARRAALSAAEAAEADMGSLTPGTATVLYECSMAMKQAGLKHDAKRYRASAERIARTLDIRDDRVLTVGIADLLPRHNVKP
jgi:tetratricopeptide (TPR) repeat protein